MGEMDLLSYILILGKMYLWTYRCKETKLSFSHFKRILLNKYQTEKYISLKSNGRRGGLMVSALVPGSSGPGSSPGRGHCVVFLCKTLYSHSASLHPGV